MGAWRLVAALATRPHPARLNRAGAGPAVSGGRAGHRRQTPEKTDGALLPGSYGVLERLDLPGVTLLTLTGGVVAIVWALVRANQSGWASAEIVSCLVYALNAVAPRELGKASLDTAKRRDHR